MLSRKISNLFTMHIPLNTYFVLEDLQDYDEGSEGKVREDDRHEGRVVEEEAARSLFSCSATQVLVLCSECVWFYFFSCKPTPCLTQCRDSCRSRI